MENLSNPVTFPIAFPTKAMNVVATLQTNGDGGNMSKNRLYIQTLTTTGFTIQNRRGTIGTTPLVIKHQWPSSEHFCPYRLNKIQYLHSSFEVF